MSKHIKIQEPSASDYKQYDQRTHVYKKSDTFIGSDERYVREEWIYCTEKERMIIKNIDIVPGCERLFLEILGNASDNVGRSYRDGLDPEDIRVTMTDKTITILNKGRGIPVEIHEDTNKYAPELIFGNLLTSSNYEVDRYEAGTNGYGAKLANIFSHRFYIEIVDHVRGLKYTQEWRDNMQVCDPPVITEVKVPASSVLVEYDMDFERFNYKYGYTDNFYALYMRHALDVSFTTKIPVYFNNVKYECGDIKTYAALYFSKDAIATSIVHTQYLTKSKKDKDKKYNRPEIEMIALDTPDEGYHVSFANGMMTKDGGVHVHAAFKALGDPMVTMLNDSIIKKLLKLNKGKELDAKTKRSHTISIQDVKPHVSILLSVRVVNPKFASQTKTILGSPTPNIVITDTMLKSLSSWSLSERLHAAVEAKQFAKMGKSDGKLNRYIQLTDAIDANNAGTSLRKDAFCAATEGKSALAYANKYMKYVPGGRDNMGVFPMRGKVYNVMGKGLMQIDKNVELTELRKMLGLVEGTDYMIDSNFNKLRYGKGLMIMADSDVDGVHIVGLILNYFHCRFPSLLKRGYVTYYKTPIIRVRQRKESHCFYNKQEHIMWEKNTPDASQWTPKYYKGLGTSKDEEIAGDYINKIIVTNVYDNDAVQALELAFHKDLANKRKEWIGKHVPLDYVYNELNQPISWFINNEMILFSIADNERSIPRLTDGFKESLRKIIHGAHRKWLPSSKKKYDDYKEYKVAQFGMFVAEKVGYHHGEQNLGDIIIGMAQDFTGANNIPWFTKDGQFGTRYQGGKDASDPRYSYTRPDSLFSYILREEDRDILTYVCDEGEKVEPETYYPVIPTVLTNGAQGIGTGYSTNIPNHDPLVLISWLIMKLNGEDDESLPELIPWYDGFKGTTQVIDRRSKKQKGMGAKRETEDYDDAVDLVEEDHDNRPLLSLTTRGIFYTTNDGTIIITELPIGMWAHTYHKWLETLIVSKQISGFSDKSLDNDIYFEIYKFTKAPSYKNLKLEKSSGMSNMVLLDEKNRPIRYNTAFDIMEAFYYRRLPIYQVRKDYMINKVKAKLPNLRDKKSFVNNVMVTKSLVVMDVTEDKIREKMAELNIPMDVYTKSKTSDFNVNQITMLQKKIDENEAYLETLLKLEIKEMWLKELEELKEAYTKYMKIKHKDDKKKSKNTKK